MILFKKEFPGLANCIRIYIENVVPIIPDIAAKIKYNVPISLWFVEKTHLFK
jgi:hypothetical protein